MDISQEEFGNLIKGLLQLDPNIKKEIANFLGVSHPTVERWASIPSGPRGQQLRNSAYKALKKRFLTD